MTQEMLDTQLHIIFENALIPLKTLHPDLTMGAVVWIRIDEFQKKHNTFAVAGYSQESRRVEQNNLTTGCEKVV